MGAVLYWIHLAQDRDKWCAVVYWIYSDKWCAVVYWIHLAQDKDK